MPSPSASVTLGKALALLLVAAASPVAAQRVPDLRVDHSSWHTYWPTIAASGRSVYVAWNDDRSSHYGPGDIYFNRSLDGGATWLPADVRLDPGSFGGSNNSDGLRLAASGAGVYAVWRDTSSGLGIYFNRSLDRGTTWLPSEMKISGPTVPLEPPGLAVAGSSVYVVWEQSPSGRSDLYFNRSIDGGTTWPFAPVRLDTGSPPGTGLSTLPTIVALGNAIYVAWRDSRNSGRFVCGHDIYFNRSLDGGATWLPSDVRVDTGTPPGTRGSGDQAIALTGSAVCVVWDEGPGCSGGGGLTDIYAARSTDGGQTWAAPIRLDTGSAVGAADSFSPNVATDGNVVYVAWSDQRNGGDEPYFNRSQDGGATWLATDVRIPTGLAAGAVQMAGSVEMVASGTLVSGFWPDGRNGLADVYYNRSLDAGTTWLSSPVRLSTGFPPGQSSSILPSPVASGSSVYAVYRENGSGFVHIHFNIPFGFLPYGAGKPGSGGFVPELDGSGAATIGSPVSLDIANGVGGATGILMGGLGSTSKVSVPLFGGTLLVAAPAPSIPIVLGGAPGIAGAGALSVPQQIPNNATLLGLDLYFQAWFLDPGATSGVSATNGLELWML